MQVEVKNKIWMSLGKASSREARGIQMGKSLFPIETRISAQTKVVVENSISVFKPSSQFPREAMYAILTLDDLEMAIDKLDEFSFSVEKVIINGFEYSRKEALERLRNLKVLLNREDLKRRISQLLELLKNRKWEDLGELLNNDIKVLKDVELFLLAAAVYKVSEGKRERYDRYIDHIVREIYGGDPFLKSLIENVYIEYIKDIPPRKRSTLSESRYIRERIIGAVWNSGKD